MDVANMEIDTEKMTNGAKQFLSIVNTKRAAVAAVMFASLIGPGYLALYRFKPHELATWDLSHILLFCLSISVPAVLMHSLALMADGEAVFEDEEKRQGLVIGGASLAALIFYLAHVIYFFEAKKPNFHDFMSFATSIQGFFWGIGFTTGIVRGVYLRRKKRKESAASGP